PVCRVGRAADRRAFGGGRRLQAPHPGSRQDLRNALARTRNIAMRTRLDGDMPAGRVTNDAFLTSTPCECGSAIGEIAQLLRSGELVTGMISPSHTKVHRHSKRRGRSSLHSLGHGSCSVLFGSLEDPMREIKMSTRNRKDAA